ncbi:MAG: TonB family protein [Acidobacteria bacterium]|nr:TonB family protein [Acidobacteriota bacterium]
MPDLLVGVALKASLALCVAWMLALLMRRWPAAARHLVWTATFTLLLVLPAAVVLTPRLTVPVDLAQLTTAAQFQVTSSVSAQQAAPVPVVRHTVVAASPVASTRVPWAAVMLGLWIAGALLGLGRTAAAWLEMIRLRASGVDLTPVNGVNVLQVAEGMPVAFGALRPVVMLPVEASGWSEERRRVVLLHELAHIHRGDPATHLIARIALCLHWWNPLVWLAWRAFLIERERAADDVVLASGERASNYAQHLFEIARELQSRPSLQRAAVAMVRTSQLEERLKSILEAKRMRHGFGRAASFAAVGLALLLSLPYAALQAQNVNAQLAPDVEATIREAAAKKSHDLLDKAATHAEAMRQFDSARKLLESSLQLRAAKDGEKSLAYGAGLLKLADLERRRNNNAIATSLYEKAVAVLGDRAESAAALTYLGVQAAAAKNLTRAEELLNRAQLLDPSNASTAMMWLALVRQHQGKADEAEGLFQAALVAENNPTWLRATMLDLYANLLRSKERGDEAKVNRERAMEIRKSLVKPAVRPTDAFRVGGGVTAPQLVFKVEPKYSEEARFAKHQGTVVVSVMVDTQGLPQNLQVIRELGLGLDERALDAISEWRFKPGYKEGQPVNVQATIEVNFRLM